MFFITCAKQEKEGKKKAQKKPIGLKPELKATEARGVHESCRESCYSYSRFLTAQLLSRKKSHSFF